VKEDERGADNVTDPPLPHFSASSSSSRLLIISGPDSTHMLTGNDRLALIYNNYN